MDHCKPRFRTRPVQVATGQDSCRLPAQIIVVHHEGDFLAKRVYKPGVYAIPYEGEEVTLHWANKDQYYIKTSEYLRDYCFRLEGSSSVQFSGFSVQTEN